MYFPAQRLNQCTSTKKQKQKKNYDVTLNKNFNTVWNKVIDYSSRSFFGIDNFEKDSGLITLSYSGDPTGYVNCGKFDYDGFISNGTQVKDYFGTFQEFAKMYYNASLNGRMNILVKKIMKTKLTFVSYSICVFF